MSDKKINIGFSSQYLSDFDEFSEIDFFERNRESLIQKKGEINDTDLQLLAILAKQVHLYVSSMRDLRQLGAVITFNNGVTAGPNPHMTIADKALNRVIQLLKELQLTSTSKDSDNGKNIKSENLLKFLNGPLASGNHILRDF
jgi:phage terminase small subunit